MAIRRLPPAALAATLALAACVSPYEDAIKTDTAACHNGDKWACATLATEISADQQWHAQKNAEVGNAILGVLAVGVAAAGVAAAAHAPPPPPPVFIPAPPIPLMPLPR